jgi:hypothetical protein
MLQFMYTVLPRWIRGKPPSSPSYKIQFESEAQAPKSETQSIDPMDRWMRPYPPCHAVV